MNLKIRNILKNYNISISELSCKLELSRPTLYNYIVTYENKRQLPNAKYQVLFDTLFGEENCSKENFYTYLNNYSNFLKYDSRLTSHSFSLDKINLLNKLLETLTDNNDAIYDEMFYSFLDLFINSYDKIPSFKKFIKYYLVLNNTYTLDALNNLEKTFVSQIFKIIHLDKTKNLEFEEFYFKKLKRRIDAIDVLKSKSANKIREKISEKLIKEKLEKRINSLIKEKLDSGFDIDEIDLDDIVKNINFSDPK